MSIRLTFYKTLDLLLISFLAFFPYLPIMAAVEGNNLPVISGMPPLKVAVNSTFSFTPVASDPDNDPLTFSITNKPAWMTFNTVTGKLSGTPTLANLGVTSTGYVISVSDNKGGTPKLAAFNIAVLASVNTPPVISGVPALKVNVGTLFSFTPVASDANNDSLTFSITNKPSWMTFDTSTGKLSGTPTLADVGITSTGYVISVSDGKGGLAKLAAFNISVISEGSVSNRPPIVSGTPLTSIQVNTAYSFTPTASDPDNNPLSFNISNRPAWATFNPATGTLSGTPTSAGNSTGIIISVSDGKGGTAALAAFAIAVTGINRPPLISGTPTITAKTGIAYRFVPIASDPDNNPFGFSVANKPAWATFDPTTGELSGTPTLANVGAFNNITISVNDGKGATAALPPFNISVTAFNIAKAFGVASQGGTYEDGSTAVANLAIDGLDDTRNHTTCDVLTDWWQVQLPKPTKISKIVVRNISSGWTARLKGASLYVTDAPYSATPADNFKVATLTDATTDQVTTFATPKTGTYVIVKAANGECLHMREVEVYGEPSAAPGTDTTPRNYLITHASPVATKIDTYTAIDYQADPIAYSLQGDVPFALDNQGNLTVNTPLTPSSTYRFVVSASDGSHANLIPVTVKTTALDAVPVALRTGDASNVTVEEILDAAIARTQSDYDYCTTELSKIYPGGNLQSIQFPAQSAYMKTLTSRNLPLHVNANNGSPQVYSWMGKKESGTPYAVVGTAVFNRIPMNTQMKNGTLNLLRWLMGRDVADNILAEPLVILAPIAAVRTGLNDWLIANSLPRNWVITGDSSLLSTGKFDLFVGDMDTNVAQVQTTFALNRPVLLYNYWYEAPSALMAEFDLKWSWYGAATIGGLNTVLNQCRSAAYDGTKLKDLFTSLKNGLPDFIYESTECVDSVGTIGCDTDQVSDATGKDATGKAIGNTVNALFMDGATTLRSLIKDIDNKGSNVFSLDASKDSIKLAVLLGDKYRAQIRYPMDKVSTDDNAFYHAYFADSAVHYARPNQYMQMDLGLYSKNNAILNAQTGKTKSVTITPTGQSEWTSTGIYLPPGKTITVRRTDTGTAKVKLRSNLLRESTRKWNRKGYNRPLYLASNEVALDVGKTYNFSTPFGGPAYLYWDAMPDNPVPFTVEFQNVLDNPLLEKFDEASVQAYLVELNISNSEWVDLKSPFAEIHSKKSYMFTAFDKQDGTEGNGFTTQDVLDYVDDLNGYLIIGNYATAGFKDPALPVLKPGVVAFCDRQGLSSVLYNGVSNANLCTDSRIHKKPKIQHINAEILAACGGLCAGNPFDTGSPVNPIGWGENHEMGHNLQVARLKIYNGRTGEVSNNIFPVSTMTRWADDHGLTQSKTDNGRPTNSVVFAMLQNAIKAGSPPSINHPLWTGGGLYDNAFERLGFYVQVAYISQTWDVYTKLMLMERIYGDALGSAVKWNAVKNLLGFGNYAIDDSQGISQNAKTITSNDFMYIALSEIEQRNYSDYFTAWGISLSQAAKDQVAANGITAQVSASYYYVPPNVMPVVMPTSADAIFLNGNSLYTDPTP